MNIVLPNFVIAFSLCCFFTLVFELCWAVLCVFNVFTYHLQKQVQDLIILWIFLNCYRTDNQTDGYRTFGGICREHDNLWCHSIQNTISHDFTPTLHILCWWISYHQGITIQTYIVFRTCIMELFLILPDCSGTLYIALSERSMIYMLFKNLVRSWL